jgi:hypothetical protein
MMTVKSFITLAPRPWWDEVEDTLLNTLVILGKPSHLSSPFYIEIKSSEVHSIPGNGS